MSAPSLPLASPLQSSRTDQVIVCYFISIEKLFEKLLFTFKTSGTVKAKEKIVQMGVRNSCMTWKMSRSCKLPFRE